jgi:protein-ribulosamine 3-kinase
MILPGILNTHFKNRFSIERAEQVGGGCINDCYKLSTTAGVFFLKLNNAALYPTMFEAEVKGLQLLNMAGKLHIPKVLDFGEKENVSFLLIEWIEKGVQQKDSLYQFGQQLAGLHQLSAPQFGLDDDNYLGSLKQSNKQTTSWAIFFIEQRLAPLLKLASNRHLVDSSVVNKFEKLFPKLEGMFPNEPPALLHGDLWSGNYHFDANGQACIYDPAVYYGFREMDIAMTRLFGGFGTDFYEGYNAHYPLQKGWRQRIDLCNLYPLLAHVNLFGSGYVPQLIQSINRFI